MFNRSTDYIEPGDVKRQATDKPLITDLSAIRNQSIESG